MEQWEYCYVKRAPRMGTPRAERQLMGMPLTGTPDVAELNEMGAEGWELAGVIQEVSASPPSVSTIGTYTEVTLIFKRRKP
jgi:hypothetical protein